MKRIKKSKEERRRINANVRDDEERKGRRKTEELRKRKNEEWRWEERKGRK